MGDGTKITGLTQPSSVAAPRIEPLPIQPQKLSPWNPTPTTNTIGISNMVQGEAKPKFPIKLLLTILVIFIFLISLTLTYYFFHVPRTRAQVYVVKVSDDYKEVIKNVKKVGTDVGNVATSFELAKGSFFEIPNLRTYSESKVDTKQDVVDIQNTISKIDDAIENKSKIPKPEEVIDLNTKLDEYYSALKDAMNIMLEYENFQIKMLNAEGDEINLQYEKFDDVYNAGVINAEVIAYYKNLAELGRAALTRYNDIGEPPADQAKFFQYILVSLQDRTDTMEQVSQYLSSAENIGLANGALLGLSQRQVIRNEANQESANEIVKNSKLKTAFDKAIMQENTLKGSMKILKKKYKIDDPDAEGTLETTIPEIKVEPTPVGLP